MYVINSYAFLNSVQLCTIGNISRASYYKWLNRKENENDRINRELSERPEQPHEEHPDMEYRRLNDKFRPNEKIHVNDKRILRLCRNRQSRTNLICRYDGGSRPSKIPDILPKMS